MVVMDFWGSWSTRTLIGAVFNTLIIGLGSQRRVFPLARLNVQDGCILAITLSQLL